MATSDIMIVDDNPANRELLENMLRQKGHAVRSFPLGRLALIAAAKDPPALILLDITMPEMDGYEVCERLKWTPALNDIPVIFLSALSELRDKVRAFQAGGCGLYIQTISLRGSACPSGDPSQIAHAAAGTETAT